MIRTQPISVLKLFLLYLDQEFFFFKQRRHTQWALSESARPKEYFLILSFCFLFVTQRLFLNDANQTLAEFSSFFLIKILTEFLNISLLQTPKICGGALNFLRIQTEFQNEGLEILVLHGLFLQWWKKVFPTFADFFHAYLMRGLQKFARIFNFMMSFSFTCKIGQPMKPIGQQFLALFWSALRKPLWELNFLHIFGIHSSSKHETFCQMLEKLFTVFHHSR